MKKQIKEQTQIDGISHMTPTEVIAYLKELEERYPSGKFEYDNDGDLFINTYREETDREYSIRVKEEQILNVIQLARMRKHLSHATDEVERLEKLTADYPPEIVNETVKRYSGDEPYLYRHGLVPVTLCDSLEESNV